MIGPNTDRLTLY